MASDRNKMHHWNYRCRKPHTGKLDPPPSLINKENHFFAWVALMCTLFYCLNDASGAIALLRLRYLS